VGSQTRMAPDPKARVAPLRPGDPRRVGGYKLTGLLGEGGMGQVFLGRSRAGHVVAVKLIRPEYARQPAFRQRFAREIAAARMVGGFRTVPVIDADPRAERPWMVTAYVPAPSLQERVDTRGPLSLRRVAELGAHLADGLAAIHACGLVHRDLKPGNILLAADGARIIDFGIARAAGAVTLTTAGTVLGTCLYASPEQLRESGITAASDIFSLGSVLAFAATGAPPFRSTTLPGIVHDITGGAPDLTAVPAPLVPLIAACLAKDPAARPGPARILARCTALIRPAPPRNQPPPGNRNQPPSRKMAPARHVTPVRNPLPPRREPSPKPVSRRVVLAGGVVAIAAAGTAFPLAFLTRPGKGRPAGPSSSASARSRPPRRPVPAISRTLVPGPSGAAGTGLDSAVLSPDGSTVAFSTSDTSGAKVRLLDAIAMNVAASIALGHGANAVVFGPDGRSLVDLGFGGRPEAAWLWRLEAVGLTALNLTASAALPGAPHVPGAVPSAVAGAVAFSPDASTLAVSGSHGLALLDAATLRPLESATAPPGAPVYRPDGKVIAVGGAPGYLSGGSAGGDLCLLDAASLGVINRRGVPDLDAYSVSFSPDGRRIALTGHGQAGGAVHLLDATSLDTVATGALPGGPGVTAAAAAGFTPDGAVLAGYSVAGHAVAWLMQASTMKVIAATQIAPARAATGLATDLSADGQTLMVAYSPRARAARVQLYRIQPG